MKNKIKGILVGLVIGIIFGSLIVSASINVIKKDLHYNDIKITLDNKEIRPTDANGNYIEPFIIDGTTYLPVRGIANALELNVEWDSKTNTVVLSSIIPEETKPVKTNDSNLTISQKNALATAKSYLAFTAFSYEGLIKQLEFEKYSHEDAVYAADNCGADWNEQAKKAAKSYLDFMSFSKEGLIEQLEFEGFTREQAVYGVEANGYN